MIADQKLKPVLTSRLKGATKSAAVLPDLAVRVAVCERSWPLTPPANGTLMARRASSHLPPAPPATLPPPPAFRSTRGPENAPGPLARDHQRAGGARGPAERL